MRHTRKKRLQGQQPGGGMHHSPHHPSHHSEPGLLQRAKVKYRSVRQEMKEKQDRGSESEALISGDDDELIIGSKALLTNALTTPGTERSNPAGSNSGGVSIRTNIVQLLS